MRRTVGSVAVAALLLAACGPDEPDDVDQTARVGELEAELAEAEREAEQLREENDELRVQLDAADAEPDDAPADDPPADEPADDDTDDPRTGGDEPAAQPQQERSPEGLVDQLRMLFPPAGAPAEWDPDSTPWQPAELPDGLQDSYETLGALAFDLAAALDAQALGMDTWETTVRALPDDEDADQAYVAVLSWGFADDAVAGRDLRVTVTGGDGAWSPGGAEERFHCRRGVTDDLCV